MKILFAETPAPWLVRQHTQIPIGLLTIATIVKKSGYNTKFIRPNTIEEILNFLSKDYYDVLALSGTTLEYPINEDIAIEVKKVFPNIKIFLGGTHASVMHKEIRETKLFDSICIGEGEEIILRMIEDIKKDNNKIRRYFSTDFIKNLDSLPFINYDLVEGPLGGTIFFGGKSYKKGNTINFITSRGCPFNCAFCASQVMWKRNVRFRSIENLIEEMKIIIKKYNIKEFRLADDNLTSNPSRCVQFCKAVKPLNIVWRCSIRAESITPEIAKNMYESGCREISPGIESGDQRVLNYLNKKTTLDKMFTGCKNAKEAGIKVRVLMMIGTPGERIDTPEKNITYLNTLPHDSVTLSTFIPLPGTPVWNNPQEFNCEILTRDFRRYNKDYFIFKNGKATKREYIPLIHNKFLTLDKQIDNVKRMEKYLEATEKYNKG